LGGPIAGLVALLLIATDPTYYGHMFINAKDVPFAAAMIFLIFSLVRAFDEYPRPRASTILIFSLALGLTIGTRIIGGVAVAFAGIAFLFLIAGDWLEIGVRPALLRAL
jgi:dolichyl-phosphate-mannose--protein O-mannosyl transferase